MKKIISIALTLALLVTTCLVAGMFPASAETTQHWLEFEANNMEYYMLNGSTHMWYAYTSNPYRCLIQPTLAVSAAGGKSVVRKFTALKSGTFRIETGTWGVYGLKVTNGASTDYVKFAITDKEGKILWPENGQSLTINSGTTHELNAAIPIETNDELYFIFYEATAETLYSYLNTVMYISDTAGNYVNQVHNGGAPANSDAGATNDGSVIYEGLGYWSYMYANSVTETDLDPNAATDNGGDIYTATYTVQEMTNIRKVNGDVNNGWLGNPEKTVGTTTFAQGQNVYLKTGETFIIRYTATEDGTFSIGYCGVKLMNSAGYDNWTSEKGVDFCIVDNDGKVIYPETGGPAKLRGTDDPTDEATVPSRVYNYNMKAGEHIDFVFKPTATLPVSTTGYVNMSGSFSFKGSRVDSSGQLGLGYTQAQGTRGVTMLYATDAVIEKTITDEWKEYVQLSKSFAAAPATIEAYVNIPTNVSDWKQGVIISDMGGEDETNGFEASVDYFGHPRLVLAGGAVDVTFDAVDLRTGTWEHIAYTYDAATGEAKFYLNGELADTKSAATATLSASDRLGVIGNDMTYTKSSAFQGAMKKLAVYSDVRTADEVAADMEGISSSADGLIGYWMLNGSYTDKSSNDNTGVLTTVGTAWYKADAPTAAEDGEFTVVHIGDQQVATDFLYGLYPKMTEWIVENKEALNIQMVVNSGDLVNLESTASQWTDAKNGMANLTNANIPFVFATGNHEYPSSGTGSRDATTFNTHFPITSYFTQGEESDTTTIIAAYPNANLLSSIEDLTVASSVTDEETGEVTVTAYKESLENAVYLKYINGVPYIYIAVEVQPRNIVVNWLNTVMPLIEAAYPDAVTTVITHHYLNINGQIDTTNGCFDDTHRTECNTPAEFYTNFVSKYASIQLVLCGHVASDVATRTDIGVNGNKIYTIMNDPSYEGDGGNGVMMLLRYKADGTVKAEYYSPLLDAYYKAGSQFTFDTAAPEEPSQYWLDFDAVEMPYYDASYNGTKTWYYDESDIPDCLMQPAMSYASPDGIATVRRFVAPKTGEFKAETIWGTTGVTVGKNSDYSVKFAITDGDGKVLWPTDGKPATLAGGTTTAITLTGVQVAKGDEINFVTYSPSAKSLSVTLKSVIRIGTTQYHDSGNLLTDFSTQGDSGWYFMYANGVKELTYNPNDPTEGVKNDFDVTYSATEGGKITAQTGGTWAADSLTVGKGGTAYFTTTPSAGYRFAGYFIDGKLYYTGRRLVYANVEADMTVEARFERIKTAGDANYDGAVDILDLVLMANDSDLVRKEMVDLVDDNIINSEDTAALRLGLLK